jgi:ABC-type lipoprotein release transport system permease subunit
VIGSAVYMKRWRPEARRLPPAQLAMFLLLAVAIGVLAAVAPARRGARLPVLEALQSE